MQNCTFLNPVYWDNTAQILKPADGELKSVQNWAFSEMVCISTSTLEISTSSRAMLVNGFTAGEIVISVFLFVLLLQALAWKLLKLLKIA